MNEKKLLMQATILIPCDFSKELDEVTEAMWKGVDDINADLIQKHPDAEVHELYHTLLKIVLTNWAITGMASHQKDLDHKVEQEKVSKVVESLKQEKDILIQYVQLLKKTITMDGLLGDNER